ncbi:MAG TPA: metallophosphoesterase family protein [Negativicutes bacterium]|nr:metallophosphoesterase family protein [Negativicutes bacterium]
MYQLKNPRRGKRTLNILFIVLFCAILTLWSPGAVFSGEISGATAVPDHVTLTWASDPSTTQSIAWRTDSKITGGQVQYVEAGETGNWPQGTEIHTAGGAGMVTPLGDMNIHAVMLTGLKPGTRYLYRVGGEEGWSAVHTFTTAPRNIERFKFLVFGDSQSTSYALWRATLHGAYGANANAAFFTNVGDLVDQGQDYNQWNGWFNAAEGVIDNIPAMPITGNHEYYTAERGRTAWPVFFTTQFKLPQNGPAELKGQVYSFDYGNVHFVMLDSQAGEGAVFVPEMLEKQKAWLEDDLQNTRQPWKIVFMHRSPYNNRLNRDNGHIRAAFVPIFERHNVQLVFTGHDHVYARTYPLRGDAPVVKGPGTVYVISGRSGTKTYPDNVARNWDEFFYDPTDEPNYLTVEVQGDSLTVNSVKLSGGLIESWSLRNKPAGE